MKALKTTGKVLLWTLGIIVVILLALPLWIGPVATGVANAVVPGVTGTDFTLGKFALNPYTGVLEVGAMDLANPTNYSEKTAVKLDNLKVDVGMTSLAGDLICVEEVALDGLFVYASGLTGGNFQDIAAHAAGGSSSPESAEKPAEKPVEPTPAEPAKTDKKGKKVMINHLVLRNVQLKIGMAPAIPVPTIELRDLGKPKDANSEGGLTLEELWVSIRDSVLAAAGSVGEGLKALGGAAGDAANKAATAAGDAANKAATAAGDAANKAAEAASDAVKNAGNALKGLFK